MQGTILPVFDDVLAGLDATTEEHIFSQIFGPEGLPAEARNYGDSCYQ